MCLYPYFYLCFHMTMAFNLYRKIVRYQNNLWFLSACYSSNVIPKGLTPKLLSPFPDAFFTRTWEDILLQCSKNLLSLLIIHYHRTIPTLRQRLHTTLENDKLQPTDYRSLHALSSDLHTKHLKKLNALQKKSSDPTRHLIAPVPSSTQPPDLTHSPDHTTDALPPATSENIPQKRRLPGPFVVQTIWTLLKSHVLSVPVPTPFVFLHPLTPLPRKTLQSRHNARLL